MIALKPTISVALDTRRANKDKLYHLFLLLFGFNNDLKSPYLMNFKTKPSALIAVYPGVNRLDTYPSFLGKLSY